MAQINISHLTFAYDGSFDNIFEDVSFQIDTDWKLGLTGRNGRGKTTFLNLLMGKYEYRGVISAPCGFEYFPFQIADDGANTMDVIMGICPGAQYWEIVRELNLLEVDEDVMYRPFSTLSHGERTKALLAALFLKENSFLLIDEPTNHLDMYSRGVVSEYLKGKKGFILVSHDRTLLDNSINHILSINKSDIELQRGNFTTWAENKARQDSFEMAENEKLVKEIKHLSASARRTSQWSDKVEQSKYGTRNSGLRPDRGFIGHKSAKMMKRSKAIQGRQLEAAEQKSRLLKNIEEQDALKVTQLPYHAKDLLFLKDISIFYGEKPACQGIGFSVRQGDRVALQGRNGSGKSSLLKLILGEDLAYTGQMQKGSGLRLSHVPQDTACLTGSLSEYAREREIDESLFKAILRKLDFSRTQFEKNMEDFSGGQKKKVLIAKSLCEQSHLLIWDEPMNYVDVISRMQIEELLLEYKPTIIFVEHDRTFCEKIATKIVSF